MNCARSQLARTIFREDTVRQRDDEQLQRIARIVTNKPIDLGELAGAISSVSGVSQRICALATEAGGRYSSLSDAVVLVGGTGILLALDEHLRTERARSSRHGLFVLQAEL
ncbi:MAG TPA: hypothetical protein VF786_08080 [Terriglobales bacterium]